MLVFCCADCLLAQSEWAKRNNDTAPDSVAAPEIDLGEINVEVQKNEGTVACPRVRANYAPALSTVDSIALRRYGFGFIFDGNGKIKSRSELLLFEHKKTISAADSIKSMTRKINKKEK